MVHAPVAEMLKKQNKFAVERSGDKLILKKTL
jgi:hypothetical protein